MNKRQAVAALIGAQGGGPTIPQGRLWGVLKTAGLRVELPDDPHALRDLGLRMITSKGAPSYLTPYGSVRSIAAFVLGETADPFYRDGETLLKASLAVAEKRKAAA